MGENSCGEESRIGIVMRWITDPRAIPGEPYGYLDLHVGKNGEIGEAKAVIVEIETPGGSRWEARTFGGKSLGTFETAGQARTAAQRYVDEIEPKRP